MTQQQFQQIAPTLPTLAGIYKYYDAGGQLLYVGKAKNIRKRVASYFSKTLTSYKTHELVQRIARMEFTIVNSEQDAFLLENSLIKQFQPIFNINLKDDKTYPYIVIKNEHFPRVYLTRQKVEDGSQYLGPYTSVGKVRELLNFIKQTIPLRTCTLNLSPRNIEKGKFKVCLEYHLGNCKGPCEAYQSEDDYNINIQQIKNLLKGNLSSVIGHFKQQLKTHVQALEFEKAEEIKAKINFLENYQSRSVVVSSVLRNVDVFAIQKNGAAAYVNYLMVSNGAIVQTKTLRLETHLDETIEETLSFAAAQIRLTFNSEAKEIIVPFQISYEEQDIVVTVPKGGDKKQLLSLAEKNVQYFIENEQARERLKLKTGGDDKTALLLKLKEDLQLSAVPMQIECFDNSNFQGSFPVAAMVSFKDGIPSKKDYRHFNIKTVEGINDFASMKEIVYRRYNKLKASGEPLPQLVIIDGGKGQLSAANEALADLGLQGTMTLIGLAKNVEEIFFVGDKESLRLPYDSATLKFLRGVRDEVHRFGISFHRLKRSKGTFKNQLAEIPGIGPATANLLLKTYRSVANVKQQPETELAKLVGKSKAKMICSYFAAAEKK